jgi:hypothetical protein
MDESGMLILLAALTVGMMVCAASLMGLGPSDVACWLELACRR